MAVGTLRNPTSITQPLNHCSFHQPLPLQTMPTPLFWYTISTASTVAALTSLSTISDFKAATHRYTTPAITLISLLVACFHVFLFRYAHGIIISKRFRFFIDISGLYIRFMIILCYIAVGEAIEVQVFVFVVAISVDLFAITKVFEDFEACQRLVYHILWGAMTRACNDYYFRGLISDGCRLALIIGIFAVEIVYLYKSSWNPHRL